MRLPERSLDTVVPVVRRSCGLSSSFCRFYEFASKGLPCAPGPATTRRGMLVVLVVTG